MRAISAAWRFIHHSFAGIGAIGVIAAALAALFFAGEVRDAGRALCSSPKAGRVLRASCILAGAEEVSAKGVQMGTETAASRKADDVVNQVAPAKPGGAPRQLISKAPRKQDIPALERRSGIDLDSDGKIAGEVPKAGPIDPETGKPLPPVKGSLLTEERFDTRNRASLNVGAYWLEDGSVDLRAAPAAKWEWLHEVRYRLSADFDGALHLNGGGQLSADWTPGRIGPLYPSLGVFVSRPAGGPTDPGARLSLELRCRGLWRCNP